MTGKLMPQIVWVYRCVDGCDGVAWSLYKRNIEETARAHKNFSGHKGIISREDFALLDTNSNL